MSQRQEALLRQLHEHPAGLSIDDLAEAMGVTRPAVRQHLAALEADGLVAPGAQRRTAGRPVQAYVLAPKGRERFPRQYGFLAGQLIKAVARREGPEGLELRKEAVSPRIASSRLRVFEHGGCVAAPGRWTGRFTLASRGPPARPEGPESAGRAG